MDSSPSSSSKGPDKFKHFNVFKRQDTKPSEEQSGKQPSIETTSSKTDGIDSIFPPKPEVNIDPNSQKYRIFDRHVAVAQQRYNDVTSLFNKCAGYLRENGLMDSGDIESLKAKAGTDLHRMIIDKSKAEAVSEYRIKKHKLHRPLLSFFHTLKALSVKQHMKPFIWEQQAKVRLEQEVKTPEQNPETSETRKPYKDSTMLFFPNKHGQR